MARQAIFDRRLEVYGYELLFRSCLNNVYDATDGDLASSQVITNSFYSIGVEKILAGKRGFINFPRKLLVGNCAEVLPPEVVVIEILESVEEDAEVLAVCQDLKRRGYLLALDDFVDSGKTGFTRLADIIKVDLQSTDAAGQAALARRYGRRGIRMLAEKVETQAEFERARRQGYSYFQGYFFARPVIMKGRETPGFKLNYLRILQELQRPEVEFGRLEGLLRPEVSLSYKLLRFVNSATFGFTRHIESLREALVLLGENEIRKWASLVVLPRLAANKPGELVLTAVVRARLCELLARPAGLGSRASELFLMGLFSLLDVMMDQPLGELLKPLHVNDDVRAALLDRAQPDNPLSAVYSLVRAHEQAEWETVSAIAGRLGVAKEMIAELYLDAVRWGDTVFAT